MDLRIDHVYLVSCKYLSRNIANPSPARLFDGLLATSGQWEQTDWYEVVAPEELRALYDACRRATGLVDLPADPGALDSEQRQRLRRALPGRAYPPEARHAYRQLCARVSTASAQRWRATLAPGARRRPNGWCGVCSASATPPTTSWGPTPAGRCASGWRARGTGARPSSSVGLDITAATSGQPQVNWTASYVEQRHRARGGRYRDTWRCAGATAVSSNRPRPRSTSTPRRTTSRATSPWSRGQPARAVGLRARLRHRPRAGPRGHDPRSARRRTRGRRRREGRWRCG